jgi:hypothetical protein
MKVLYQDYNFNASSNQITFNTTENISLSNVLLVTNVTDNVIIYNFADPLLGGTISNNILTLTYNTTTMSNTDSLQIYLDLYGAPATEETLLVLQDQNDLLRRLLQLVAPLSTQDANQRQRVSIDASNTNLNIGTVTTLSNTQAYGGVDGRFQFADSARLTYAQGIRRNLQFS